MKYTKIITENPYYEVIIVADGNDMDYVTTEQIYSKSEFEKEMSYIMYRLTQLVNVSHALRENLPEFLQYFDLDVSLPYYCDEICHTIKTLEITYHEEGSTYEVTFDEVPKIDTRSNLYDYILQTIQGGNKALESILERIGIPEEHFGMDCIEELGK